MKNRIIRLLLAWNYSLLFFVLMFLYGIPLLPSGVESHAYNICLTLIFILSALNIERYKNTILTASMISLVLLWISILFRFDILIWLSRIAGVAFFCAIVFSFIATISRSLTVNQKVILQSINGYLLLGIMYSLIIGLLVSINPNTLNFPEGDMVSGYDAGSFSSFVYFVLITISTVGYGDIVPGTPIARSLATFISISGQLYIAIIIALLVGKFAGRQKYSGINQQSTNE
ncbi:MAG: potassium channel family protein [Bacteroidales bacterium]